MKATLGGALLFFVFLSGCSGKPSECQELESVISKFHDQAMDHAETSREKADIRRTTAALSKEVKDIYADKSATKEQKSAACKSLVFQLTSWQHPKVVK